MDIQFLLLLQNFRNGIGSCLTAFLAKMTFFGELNTTIIFIASIYWCLSKDLGTYLFLGFSGNRLVNGVLKVSACVYRPWIRDARIVPESSALKTATGYSFPSGHSMNGTTFFGGLALRKELSRVLRVIALVVMLLVSFSRNFLGVHTPQDVLAGMTLGIIVMWLTQKIIDWAEKKSGRDILVMGIGLLLSLALSLYAAFKSYPTDFDADGKLLVDGAKMANDTFRGTGWCTAVFIGWVLERRFVKFSTDGLSLGERATRLAAGLLSYYALDLILFRLLKTVIGGAFGTFFSCFLELFYVIFLFPLLMCRNKGRDVEEKSSLN